MNESSTSLGDTLLEPRATVQINVADIPERYPARVDALLTSPAGALARTMGIGKEGVVITLPTGGVQERLRSAGLESPFDLEPAEEGVVTSTKYLQLVTSDRAPFGVDKPHHMLHDMVFHGIGFVSLDEDITGVIKEAAQYALSTHDEAVIDRCVFAIDELTGAFFVTTIDESISLSDALSDTLSRLKDLWKIPQPTDTMMEAHQRSQGRNAPNWVIGDLVTNQVQYYASFLAQAASLEN